MTDGSCIRYLLNNLEKMLSIHMNMSSLLAQRNLGIAHSSIATSLERLSSGCKINRASDNAANLAISKGMSCQLSGTTVALENAAHGMNILDTADGALANMTEKVNRIRDLCLKSMNGTYSDAERSMMQREVDKLTEEIYREKNSTTFSDIKLFESKAPPDSGGGGSPPVGEPDNNIQTLSAGATRSVSATYAVRASEKPYAYEVEYIESTGTQYIDTGYTCSQDDSYTYVMSGDFTGNTNKWNGANAYLQMQYSYNKVGIGVGNTATLTGNDTIVCQYKNRKETLVVNGENITTRDWNNQYSNPNVKIGIFKLGEQSNTWYREQGIKGKLTSFQLYKDDVLVRDYVPVVDKNDVACLYDKVSGQMFYNVGTGQFAVGAEIKEPEPPAPPEEPKPTPKPTPPKPVEPTYRTGNITLQIGANSGRDNQMDIDLAFDLDGFSADITSADKAAETLEKVDALKELLSAKRSEAGAQRNRLDSVISAGLIRKENLGSSYSTIMDTDFASETAKLTKQQILQQASASLLAQANIVPNIALSLLS